MKKFLSIFGLALLIIVGFTSCKKEKADDVQIVNLDVTLAAGAVYNLDLSKYGDADDIAKIFTQAEHFDISEITGTTGKYNYQYKVAAIPKVNFAGTDKVVIKLTEPARGGERNGGNSNGGFCGTTDGAGDEAIITINFKIQ